MRSASRVISRRCIGRHGAIGAGRYGMLRRLLRQLLGARAAGSAELIARGRAERERGEPAAALATLEAALRQDAGDAAVLAELRLTHRALGRGDAARALLERAAAR